MPYFVVRSTTSGDPRLNIGALARREPFAPLEAAKRWVSEHDADGEWRIIAGEDVLEALGTTVGIAIPLEAREAFARAEARDLSRASRNVSRAPSGRFLWFMLSGALLLLSVLLLSPLLFGLSGCPIIGDQSHDVTIRNATNLPLVLYEHGRAYPQYSESLDPRAVLQSGWLVPCGEARHTARFAHVEAADNTGQLIFCQSYTYDDLERLGWTIEVMEDQNTCT